LSESLGDPDLFCENGEVSISNSSSNKHYTVLECHWMWL